MEHLGQHVIIELWGCNDSINDAEKVRTAMVKAVEAANATLLSLNVHTFSPHGVTGVAVLSESHLSIHSWPEHGYVAADVFTCGDTTRPRAAAEVLKKAFGASLCDLRELTRGAFPSSTTSGRQLKPKPPALREPAAV